MNNLHLTWLLSGLLLAGPAALASEMYRWVDEQGKVHFSDRPPVEAKAENIEHKLRPINTADAPQPKDTARHGGDADPEQEYESRQQQRQLAQQQKMLNACNAAKKKLRILQGPVALIDENGKEIKISERERQQMAAQLQSEIRGKCGQL
ncbi:protein of unknown function [Microbulbifer thermotolerans]|uniref:DUF4124 domain-containing protein n=1 Tax=Microbulbifer thermotolerans TaxID=252514 RepID=UPI0008E3376C|nr:DUF4124 domain-containing protein [Microbulbifer thermotolerans]SFC09058.1 protein of unknown function [Microbulbifer thermotolerans]